MDSLETALFFHNFVFLTWQQSGREEGEDDGIGYWQAIMVTAGCKVTKAVWPEKHQKTIVILHQHSFTLKCSSDQSWKKYLKSLCVDLTGRARQESKLLKNVSRQMYSYVKLNFKASLFFPTFLFERSFIAESAFLVYGICAL